MYECVYVYIYGWMNVCMYVYMYGWMYECVNACMYANMYVCSIFRRSSLCYTESTITWTCTRRTCVTNCNSTCDLSWTLRDQQISTTSQLTLTNITRSQTGNVYTCTATNTVTHKSKTKQFTLTVYCEHYSGTEFCDKIYQSVNQ